MNVVFFFFFFFFFFFVVVENFTLSGDMKAKAIPE